MKKCCIFLCIGLCACLLLASCKAQDDKSPYDTSSSAMESETVSETASLTCGLPEEVGYNLLFPAAEEVLSASRPDGKIELISAERVAMIGEDVAQYGIPVLAERIVRRLVNQAKLLADLVLTQKDKTFVLPAFDDCEEVELDSSSDPMGSILAYELYLLTPEAYRFDGQDVNGDALLAVSYDGLAHCLCLPVIKTEGLGISPEGVLDAMRSGELQTLWIGGNIRNYDGVVSMRDAEVELLTLYDVTHGADVLFGGDSPAFYAAKEREKLA